MPIADNTEADHRRWLNKLTLMNVGISKENLFFVFFLVERENILTIWFHCFNLNNFKFCFTNYRVTPISFRCNKKGKTKSVCIFNSNTITTNINLFFSIGQTKRMDWTLIRFFFTCKNRNGFPFNPNKYSSFFRHFLLSLAILTL